MRYKDDGDTLLRMMELGTMMELSCWADNEAGSARDDDDGAGLLDIFSKQ